MAFRQTLDRYTINNAEVSLHVDTGGPIGGHTYVVIEGEDYRLSRTFYFDEFHEQYARNFAQKIVSDEEYRRKSMDEEADWARISDHYGKGSKRIYRRLVHANADTDSVESRCKKLFEDLKQAVRSGDATDQQLQQLISEHEQRTQQQLEQELAEDEAPETIPDPRDDP